ncbi:hypothetical protein BH23CHL8_BH23CHL8_23280 [soil metagenome]
MLGLEQAFRRTPPAEVVVHEHRPVPGRSGDGGELSLVFPDDVEAAGAPHDGPPGDPESS